MVFLRDLRVFTLSLKILRVWWRIAAINCKWLSRRYIRRHLSNHWVIHWWRQMTIISPIRRRWRNCGVVIGFRINLRFISNLFWIRNTMYIRITTRINDLAWIQTSWSREKLFHMEGILLIWVQIVRWITFISNMRILMFLR